MKNERKTNRMGNLLRGIRTIRKIITNRPGLLGSFPFLSQIAQNFTLYEFVGLVFEYRPLYGESGTSNSLGKVIMATDYDPDAKVFGNSRAMENYDYAVSSKPSVGMLHGVETARRSTATNMLYVRTGEQVRDKIFSDYGLFQIATEGIPFDPSSAATATVTVGELWVSYKIRLSRATMDQSYSLSKQMIDNFIFACTTPSSGILTSPINNAVPALFDVQSGAAVTSISSYFDGSIIAGAILPNKKNNLGGAISISGLAVTYTFPVNIVAGRFVLSMQEGSTSDLSNNTWNASCVYANCKVVSHICPGLVKFTGGSEMATVPNISSANNGKSQIVQLVVDIDAPGITVATVTFTYNNTSVFNVAAIGTVYFNLQVCQVNQDFAV